jgi:glycosidase
MRIYQLFVRLFGNTNETRKPNGTLAENGVGKFADINDAALVSLGKMGFTHIWLTGVLQQATGTDYASIGAPADDPDLLKGIAGSPYAIKDYFDVCPDYAVAPAKRLDEFKTLLERIHRHGMKVIVDLVPNHVARSYKSDVKPEMNFGANDDRTKFFSANNNFFYLTPDANGPPLRLPTIKDGQPQSPTCKVAGVTCDGFFDGEKDHGKVTGNNVASWTPSINDWYETVKLNYGFNFIDRNTREFPNATAPDKPVPDTWKKMAAIIDHWESLGVDGFRCDMSHMVPPEFWKWVITEARKKNVDLVFIGEAYDNDPAKVPSAESAASGKQTNVMVDLLDAGFNAVYDDPTYRAIKKIYEGPGWANDIDFGRDPLVFERSLRYAENHDEVRLAAKSQWGGLGMKVGAPISAILFGLSRGPVMLYNGQEVGEPGAGSEGFGSDDARTSIFDYWSMPELVKWVNGHKYDGGKLSDEQKQLRAFYSRLLNLLNEPAFRDGEFIPLNESNKNNVSYGRLPNETVSGHWFYSFARIDKASGQRFVGAVNLNPTTSLKDISVRVPESVLPALATASPSGGGQDRQSRLRIVDRLNETPLADVRSTIGFVRDGGVPIAELPPLSAAYLELKLESVN